MKTLVVMLRELALIQPDKTAIVDQDGRRATSYAQLDALSARVAALLVQSGVGRNDIVPILLPRDVQYVAAIAGVFKAGAAIAPLDPAYPAERINYIKKDCGCPVAIDEDFMKRALSAKPLEHLIESTASDRALVTYTSGSTGKPKGVVHSWTGVMAGVERIRNISNVCAEDVIACSAPFSFIALLLDLLTPLALGATVHILSNERRRDVLKIADYIAEFDITGIFLSPQMLKNFHSRGAGLRYVLTGSERLSKVAPGNYSLYNIYGMSEIPLTISSFRVDKAYENTPIGKVSDGLEVALLGDDGVPGDEGEICVCGELFLEYLNLPEATAKAFSTINGKRYFHTGDLARRLPDGNMEYINRKDWMVKVNGQRVEPGEIEHAMASHPDVGTAVVKQFENEHGQNYLCGYYKAQKPLPAADMRAWLQTLLPDYMVPLYLVQLEAFPINANGKLDRLKLTPPDASLFQAHYAAPESEAQAELCKGFERILKLERVGIHDDFFALGGDSIKSVMLQETCGGLLLAVMDIFEGRTPAGIAERLAAQVTFDHGDAFEGCDVTPGPRRLTDSQLGVYLECVQSPAATMYNIPCRFRFPKGAVDVDRLRDAIRAAVDAYPVFRTKTGFLGSEPALIPDAKMPCEIPVNQAREEDMEAIGRAFVRPFDLAAGPLFRFEIDRTEVADYLFMDIHHIIFDGASADVFLRQISRAYAGEPLQPEAVNAFALPDRERRFRESDAFKAARDHFASFLDGNEVDSNIIFDHKPEPDAGDAPAGRYVRDLSGALTVEVAEHFARCAAITEGTIFLGAFGYALSKFTGQTESLFATVNNGRHDPRLKNTIGMLVRTLPVYARYDDHEEIAGALRALQDQFYQSMRHDEFPFEQMAREFGVKSDILYVYQAETLNGFRLGACDTALETLETGCALANISVMVFRRGGSYTVSIDYRSDLYDRATIERFAYVFEAVLRGMVRCKTLAEIQIVSEADAMFIDRMNATESAYDRTASLVDLLRAQSAKTPDHPAVVYRDRRLTYRALDHLTDNLACSIRDLGIGREDVVSILIPRNEYMAVASIGVSKAGAAYQPLDPAYPPERLSFMIKDAEAKLLIADESFVGLVKDYDGPVLLTKDIPSLPDAAPDFAGPRPNDLFILLYTSGTTGLPKGCMLEHGNIVAFCHWYCRYYGLNASSRVTAYASYGFDANMMDMYPALVSGGTVYVNDDEIRLELDALNEYFSANGITHGFMTTQVSRQFAVGIKRHTLKCLSMGGEKLVPFEPPEGLRVFNLYGPTECTVVSTAFEIDRLYDSVPIGKPLDNMKLYVVDRENRLMPVGVPGELLVAGHQVTRGYLNRPEQTEKAYAPNPFCDRQGYDRVYHTGDIVRLLPDGNVEFVGRRDSQVKIRGYRIELTEVEAVIRAFPGISDATVTAQDAPAGGKQIVAYVVAQEKVDILALNEFILSQKPPYMVPTATMQIAAIPLNPNGKVDRRKLPPIAPPAPVAENAGHAMNLLEKQIFEAVRGVLGHAEVSVTTNLLMAGLTSLSAVRLSSMLNERFGHSPDVKRLLKGCNIVDIEDELIGHMLSAARQNQPASGQPRPDKYPLTQTQTGIYLECERSGKSDVYNIPMLLRLPLAADVNRLAEAVYSAVQAHPAMKCSIEADAQGNLLMVPHDALAWNVEISEISERELLVLRDSGLTTIFSLDTAPLFAFKVFRTEANVYLMMDIHHIIADGASLNVFIGDISRAYAGEALEEEQYSAFDLALDEAKERESEAYREAKTYYDGIFRGVEVDSLPGADLVAGSNVPEGASGDSGICRTHTHLAGRLHPEAVDRYCKAYGVTPNALFTAAFAYALARWTNQSSVVFTAIYNGRTDPRTFPMVGMLVKTLPVYAQIDDARSVGEYVSAMKEHLAGLMANDLFSFAEASRAYGIRSDVIFAYQGDDFTSFSIAGHPAEQVALPLHTAKAPLSIDVFREGDAHRFNWEYRADMYSEGLIASLADATATAVLSMLTADRLGDVRITSPEALALLERFNDTFWPVTQKPAYRLMEEQAQRTPDRTAVIACGEKLTYRRLNEQANRVANALIRAGVGPNAIVGVMLERSQYVPIARQGILKAGGAFLCIDPEYPDNRVAYTIEDSGMRHLIVTRDILACRSDLLTRADLKVSLIEEMLLEESSENPGVPVDPDDICYCIYTSGSTGRPKGVMISQRNLVNFVDANPRNPEILGYTQRGSVSLALAAITFDVSIMEEFIPLTHGLTICMASEEEIHNPLALSRLILENDVDIMTCTPSFLMNIIDIAEISPAIKRIAAYDIGAEAFPAALFDKIYAIRPDAHIMNGYGPSEATISCTMAVITSRDHVTIGRPAANVRAYMLNSNGNVLPAGALGEMTLCGEGIGLGYIGLDEMTREKFISLAGLRAYRTGDLAQWTTEGEIKFRGRTDNQVKLRGLRVELGEIETAINDFSGVSTSIVLVRGGELDQFLAAYFTAADIIDKQVLTEYLTQRLTAYMVPSVMIQLDSMPLTANGKIDKKALPELEFGAIEREYAAPVNELECVFCELFESILTLARVGATDNFFEIGGTSLSASKVAMFAMAKGYAIVYADVFKAPTARQLAELAAARRDQSAPAASTKEAADPVADYDYARLAPALAPNRVERVNQSVFGDVTDILLTGATGFLGMHILHEFLSHYPGKVYCLVRRGRANSVSHRLKTMLVYYFNRAYEELFDTRIFCVEGDITDDGVVGNLSDIKFDTLVNCAACVKHFVADDSLERINVRGVENLVALCRRTGRRLVQISTVSIAGEGKKGTPPADRRLAEHELYIGQALDNAYIHSKFLAERTVLAAIAEGLDARIMRVGNLMSRASDGEFQINFLTNGFMRQLRGYRALGVFPMGAMNVPVEFSPIDSTAAAILKLAGMGGGFTVFHPYNNHVIYMSDVISAMNQCGFGIEVVPDEAFQLALHAALEDSNLNATVSGLIAYQSDDSGDKTYMLDADNRFTTEVLYRAGFKWPITGDSYLQGAVRALEGLGFFER